MTGWMPTLPWTPLGLQALAQQKQKRKAGVHGRHSSLGCTALTWMAIWGSTIRHHWEMGCMNQKEMEMPGRTADDHP